MLEVCIYIALYTGSHVSISFATCKEKQDGYVVCMCMSCLLSYIVIVLYRASALVVDSWLLGVGSTSYICVPVYLVQELHVPCL